MRTRTTQPKRSKPTRKADKPKRRPKLPVATLKAGFQATPDEGGTASMKPDRATVMSMELPEAGTSQHSVSAPSKISPSEPPASPPGNGEVQGSLDAPGNATDKEEEVLELLAFQLADEEYALDILTIKEIIRSLEITHVPRRPSFIKGIISLRGTIIPIYDLRTRFGLKESPPTRNTRTLVVELNKGLIGIIADRVTEVVKVKGRDVEPPPATVDGMTAGHLKGVTMVNGRLIILLDLIKAVTL